MVAPRPRRTGTAVKPAAARVEALDAFRGIAIASMILVNNPGSWSHVFEPLQHAGWNEWTVADLIFPSFIFILGMAIPFALERFAAGGDLRSEVYPRILRRAAALILLGLLLNALGAADPAAMRIPGVLQRIGLVYLATAVLVLHAGPRTRVAIALAVLGVHWALLTRVPFGGVPASAPTATHNLASYLDGLVFGRHMLAPNGDPEGLLGTLSAIGTAVIGTLAGDWVRRAAPDWRATFGGLAGAGLVLLSVGLAWSIVLPLNKPLWTGSFALVAGGVALLVFALCYAVIDVAALRRWARPFVWLGVNPLAIYFLSELFAELIERPWPSHGAASSAKSWLYWTVLEPRLEPFIGGQATSLVFALSMVAVWLAVAAALHRRGFRVHL